MKLNSQDQKQSQSVDIEACVDSTGPAILAMNVEVVWNPEGECEIDLMKTAIYSTYPLLQQCPRALYESLAGLHQIINCHVGRRHIDVVCRQITTMQASICHIIDWRAVQVIEHKLAYIACTISKLRNMHSKFTYDDVFALAVSLLDPHHTLVAIPDLSNGTASTYKLDRTYATVPYLHKSGGPRLDRHDDYLCADNRFVAGGGEELLKSFVRACAATYIAWCEVQSRW